MRFAGTAPNKLLLYCQSCNFVARYLVLQIIMHDIAIDLSAEPAVLLTGKTHLCLDTRQSEFNMVFEIPARQYLEESLSILSQWQLSGFINERSATSTTLVQWYNVVSQSRGLSMNLRCSKCEV